MADPNKFQGLLSQMGVLSPTEKAQQQYQNQMAALQQSLALRQQNMQAGQMGASFGFPVYLMEQAMNGGGKNASLNIPDMPQQEDTSMQESVVSQGMQQPGKYSEQLMAMSQKMLESGDTNRASQLQRIAVEAAQQEEELRIKQEEEARKQTELTKPSGMDAVGVAGNPKGRQRQYTQYNPQTKQWEFKNQGPSYEVSGNETNISGLGDLLTKPQEGKAVEDFAKSSVAAENFINAAEPVYNLLSEGAKSGLTGNLLSKVDNAVATVKNTVQALSDDPGKLKMAEMEITSSATWKEMAKKTHLSEALLVGLMYADAASFNHDGRISDQDLKASGRKLGENLSDPASARDVLKQAIDQMKMRYTTDYENLPYKKIQDDRKNQYDRILGKYSTFQEKTTPKGTKAVDMKDPKQVEARIKELEALLNQPSK